MTTATGDDGRRIVVELQHPPRRISQELRQELRSLQAPIQYEPRVRYGAGSGPAEARPVPSWCRSPFLRGWVIGHAIAAPLVLLILLIR